MTIHSTHAPKVPSVSYVSASSVPMTMQWPDAKAMIRKPDWDDDWDAVQMEEATKAMDKLAKKISRGTGMKLVHYVIVDVDPRWLKEVPHKAILDSEMVVMGDERSFLLGLDIKEMLVSHNAERREVTYADKDGDEKHFKDIGPDKIDVVINVLKEL